MNAAEILEKLQKIGVEVSIGSTSDKIRLNPGAAVPPDLLAEIKEHKPELLRILKLRGYQPKYAEPEATNKELAEIAARVYQTGYVLLWSNTLDDLVAFYKCDSDKAKIPPGFVPYSLQELVELFGGKKPLPIGKLRLIHAAKAQGAKVQPAYPKSDKPILEGEM